MRYKSKIFSFIISLFLIINLNANATIYYVKEVATGTGDGSSWTNASSNLQSMILAAQPGDEIWVAKGTYLPTSVPDANGNIGVRDAAFVLKSGVKIYGSFQGNEESLEDRVFGEDRTILSGNIGNVNDKTDNTYHVVLSINNNKNTILDGVTIAHGFANGDGFIDIAGQQIIRSQGGGLFTRGSEAIFSNVIFQYNECYTTSINGFGGAIYSLTSSISISDALFEYNKADAPATAGGAGGAIYLLGNIDTVGQTKIVNTTFQYNTSKGAGGAIFAQHFSNLDLDNVEFNNNSSNSSGGGLIILGNLVKHNIFNMNNCVLYSNKATGGSGGGMMLSFYVDATIDSTNFYENTSSAVGGGLYSIGGSATLINDIKISSSDFYKNHSNTNGGGFYINEFTNSKISNSKFRENTATTNGGAFFIIGNTIKYNDFYLEGNLFSKNSSSGNAGVAYISSFTKSYIDRNKFYENKTNGAGGVFFIFNAAIPQAHEDIYLTNNIFYANESKSTTLGGGAIFTSNNTRPSIINNTFYKNTSVFNGGAIMVFNSTAAGAKIYNSIFFENFSSTADHDIHKGALAVFEIKNSSTQNYGVINYDGMIVAQDPGFITVNELEDDFLKINSLSVVADKGDSSFLPTFSKLDLAGNSRVFGNEIDMGAYEYNAPITNPTQPQEITFNLPNNKVYGDPDFEPDATSTSGLAILYTSSNAQVATIVNGKIKIIGAGSSEITANQLGNDEFYPADPVSKTLVVSKAPLIVKPADTIATQLNTFPVFRITYNGFVNGENENVLLVKPTVTTTATTNSSTGTYPLIASGASTNKYEIIYQEGVLTLNPTPVDKNKLEVWFPNTSLLQINVDVDKTETVNVVLYSGIGQKIYSTVASLKPGRNQLSIPADKLLSGVYILNIKGGSVQLDTKFIKR